MMVMSCWVKFILFQIVKLLLDCFRWFSILRWILNIFCNWKFQRFWTSWNIFNILNVIVSFMLKIVMSRRSSAQPFTTFRSLCWSCFTYSTSSRCFWIDFWFQTRFSLRLGRLRRKPFYFCWFFFWFNRRFLRGHFWRDFNFLGCILINHRLTDSYLLVSWWSSWWLWSRGFNRSMRLRLFWLLYHMLWSLYDWFLLYSLTFLGRDWRIMNRFGLRRESFLWNFWSFLIYLFLLFSY